MSELEKSNCSTFSTKWHEVVLAVCRSPVPRIECPVCQTTTLAVAWHLVDPLSREVAIDLHCSSCRAAERFTMVLPSEAVAFYPSDRIALFATAVNVHAKSIGERIFQYAKSMPAAAFTTHPLWAEARWNATTFQWHPTSEAPPIMGLVFDNAEAGKEIFREAERQMNHTDRFEEIRVSIIEGAVPGEERRPGYSVHISPDPEALDAHATAEDFVVDRNVVPFLGQWNRHYPELGLPALLPKFKREFAKHNEFMLAPVTRRADGQLFCDPELGIIKNIILFRSLAEVTPDDPDAAALVLPQLITPPGE